MLLNNTRRTSTITFRLDDELITKLREESKNKEVSTNTLVNQALKRFLDWDVFLPQIGLVSVNKPVFVKIFGHLKEKEVTKMASTIGKDEICNIALFMKGKMDLPSFMSWFEMKMVNSSVKISHVIDKQYNTYVFKHDLGRNWSLYHKTILEMIFQEVFAKKINIAYDKSLIRLQFIVDDDDSIFRN